MFAKPRAVPGPRIVKPLMPFDSNGNPIQSQMSTKSGKSPASAKAPTTTPTKQFDRAKFNAFDSLPLKSKTAARSFRTSPKIPPPSFEPPEEITAGVESMLSPSRPRTQKLPFPKMESDTPHDKAAELVTYLQILQKLRKSQLQERGIPKKKDYPAETKFEFSTAMFYANSTEMLLQVTHLLFEVIDEEEFSQRFRDCWPIHDRKQEALYRRIAFEWVQQICMENPEYFRVQPNLAMFVSPTGDKFIRFLLGFVQCTMALVANRMQVEDKEEADVTELLERPQFTGVSEVSRKQIYVFQSENEKLVETLTDANKRTSQHIEDHNKRQRNIEAELQEEELQQTEEMRQVLHYINQYPNWFPDNSEQILSSVREELMSEISVDDTNGLCLPDVEDPLATTLNQAWIEQSMRLEEKCSKVLNFCENRHDLVTFIKALEANFDLVLDGKDIPGLFQEGETSDLPDLNSYLCTCMERINALKEDFPSSGIQILLEPNFHKQLAFQIQKADLLRSQAKALLESAKIGSDKLKDLRFRAKTMRMKLDHINWNTLLPLGSKNLGLEEVLAITPEKQYDLNKPTGRTPLMQAILPSPVITPDETPPKANYRRALPHAHLRRQVLQNHHISKLSTQIQSQSSSHKLHVQKTSKNMESPVTSRPAVQPSVRALHAEKTKISSGKLTCQTTEKENKPEPVPEKTATAHGIRLSTGDLSDCSSVDVSEYSASVTIIAANCTPNVSDSSASITVIAANSAARRKSHEHSARLKNAVRFSESPVRVSMNESSGSFRKGSSIVETEGTEEVLKMQRSLECEDALGIQDLSICDLGFSSSDED